MNSDTYLKNKKVLVAGGAGFVGANLINRLLQAGAHVRATLHEKPAVITDPRVAYLTIDLRKPEDCARAVAGIDYVFMVAAHSSGAAVIQKTPLVHVTPNVIMNTLMLQAAHAAGVQKYLWLSSNTVYPAVDHPVTEEEMMSGPPFEKYFPVASMKRFGETLCEIYSSKIPDPMTTVVVRPANIYGPYDDFAWESSHVVPALIRKVAERHAPLEVWGDGTEVKDLIYIDDFIDGMLLAMEKMTAFDPINIGTGIPVSITDVLNAALAATDWHDPMITFNTSKPTMIPKRLINVSKAERELGFRATTSLTDGIRKTLEWYIQHPA
jgi:GDP-L-fucose synthase